MRSTNIASPKRLFLFRAALIAILLAGFLAGPGMTGTAIPGPPDPYTGCANPDDQTDMPEAECLALVALYNSAAGASWTTNTGWLATANPCSWFGVTCATGRVSSLQLGVNNLAGPIPPEIGALTAMHTLNMQGGGNFLSGPIPTEMANLTSLDYLNLCGNTLSGEIPSELGNLSSLTSLLLCGNYFTGGIPSSLGSLPGLISLQVWGNQLIGTVPAELGGISSLNTLTLSSNLLSGPFPMALTSLSLTTLTYNNTSLCAPGNSQFQEWVGGIASVTSSGYNCDLIFVDGFESGDTTAWSSTVESPAQLGGLFSGQYIPPGLGLIVHPKAAMQGGFGLGAIVEDRHPMFVQDDSPTAETTYRASFYLLVKTLTAGNNKGMGILMGSGTGKSFQMFTGWDGAQHVVVARAGLDNGGWYWTDFNAIPTNTWVFVEIVWMAATGPGNNDGWFALYLDGDLKNAFTMDNDTVRIDTVRLGPAYVSPGATGIIGFDSFTSDSGAYIP